MSVLDKRSLAYYFEANANDSVGSSHGTSTNVNFVAGAGKVGNGAEFPGTSSVIKNTTFALPTSEITIAIWLKTSDITTAKEIFMIGADGILDSNSVRHMEFRLELPAGSTRQAGYIQFIGGTYSQIYSSGLNLTDNTYHLFIARCKSGTQSLRIDNVNRGTDNKTGSMPSRTGFAIGDISENPSLHWHVPANYDMLYIFNEYLTDSECDELWNGGAGLVPGGIANHGFFF